MNGARVVHDTIDGEVIAIRNDTGAYYSMTGTATSIWLALSHGLDTTNAATLVAAHHGVDLDVVPFSVSPAVEEFAECLVANGLLVPAESSACDVVVELPAETAAFGWAEPELQEYTDMADLLLFDPIHEVGPEGWPDVLEDRRRPA